MCSVAVRLNKDSEAVGMAGRRKKYPTSAPGGRYEQRRGAEPLPDLAEPGQSSLLHETADAVAGAEIGTVAITIAGREYVAVPVKRYRTMAAATEHAEDVALLDTVAADRNEEQIPSEIVDRLVAGEEHPLKVWRTWRRMSQDELALAAGVAQSTISQIERGEIAGKVSTLEAFAKALDVMVDDLLP